MSGSRETRIAEADLKLELVEALLKRLVDTLLRSDEVTASDLATALRHVSEARSKLRGEL
jgi:hypothetical protein